MEKTRFIEITKPLLFLMRLFSASVRWYVVPHVWYHKMYKSTDDVKIIMMYANTTHDVIQMECVYDVDIIPAYDTLPYVKSQHSAEHTVHVASGPFSSLPRLIFLWR